MSEYIEFEVFGPKPGCKTSLCIVRSNRSNETLGIIKWYSQWRQYAFYPVPNTIYATDCMKDIIEQIDKMKIDLDSSKEEVTNAK